MNDRQDPPPPDDWPGDRPYDPHAPADPYGTGAGYPPGASYQAPYQSSYQADGSYPQDGYQQGGYPQQPQGYGYDAYQQPDQAGYPAPGQQQGYQQGYPQGEGYDPYGGPGAPQPGQGHGDAYGQRPGVGQPAPYDPYGGGPHQPHARQGQAPQGQHGFPDTYGAPQAYPAQPDQPQPYQGQGPDGPRPPGADQPNPTGRRGHAAPTAPQESPASPPDGYGYDAYGRPVPQTATHRRVPRQGQPAQTRPDQGPGEQGRPGQASADGAWLPRQAEARQAPATDRAPGRGSDEAPGRSGPAQGEGGAPGREGADGADDDYRTEQFSFIEEPDEESEDVIDWLKFAETRSERRDGRKRQLRTRLIGLVAALALVVGCGVGYLWYADKLPGVSSGGDDEAATDGPQRRQVIVVHLRETKGGGSSSALLVDNETTKKGSTVLLPNALAVAGENGTTTLGNAVEDEGAGGTRDALSTLLGSEIQGTWRLDTPYLENLVELVGGITLDTDVAVPGAKQGEAPLVKSGEDVQLGGQGAVAYATHQEPGEDQAKQLTRFGQVMEAVLKKVSTEPEKATTTVEQLSQIPDPSLSEKQLGASLAGLAQRAQDGSYATDLLDVQSDGTLSQEATENVVKDVLGGSVKKPDDAAGSPARVSVRDATGDDKKASSAQVSLVNGGFTVVGGGTGAAEPTSRVSYADAAQAGQAKEVAATLGLPESAVRQGKGAANADVTVVLGRDYKGQQG
ncbi:LytR C-terminal domain-containing protein [Streptomyces sp. 71268]|uniref:LytR C-terminal domain-containing protein n=1 Tax=Streptomyces sp. 71268 TaxID=3002640 RepID=UPI0023F7CC38|nr:LytR C-terminal domain-containing protein [Streptomyces sp. 71268]WEV27879.1 LytR C-terminal domain-containing protein [Streptomyces sp. 71268]